MLDDAAISPNTQTQENIEETQEQEVVQAGEHQTASAKSSDEGVVNPYDDEAGEPEENACSADVDETEATVTTTEQGWDTDESKEKAEVKQVDEAQQDSSSSEMQDPVTTDDATNSDGMTLDGDDEEKRQQKATATAISIVSEWKRNWRSCA